MIVEINDLVEIQCTIKNEGQTPIDALIDCLNHLIQERPALCEIRRVDIETTGDKVTVKVYK